MASITSPHSLTNSACELVWNCKQLMAWIASSVTTKFLWRNTIGYDSDNKNRFYKKQYISRFHTIKIKLAFILPLDVIHLFGLVLKSDWKVMFEDSCWLLLFTWYWALIDFISLGNSLRNSVSVSTLIDYC